MKKIVIATDFMESSDGALTYAGFLAEQFSAELSVIHVYFPVVAADASLPYDNIAPISMQEEVIHVYESKLKEIVESLKNKKIKATSELVVGSLSSSVTSYAEEKGADLIVVGKTPENSFFDRLIGSSASDIVKNTSIPVLIVPATSHKPVFDIMVYGTELESEEKEVLRRVFKIAQKLGSKITLLKINVAFEPDIQDDNQVLADIQMNFQKEKFSFETVSADNISEGLLNAAHSLKADILVVARHHHNFLSEIVNPSKSKKIIGKTDIPLLVYDLEA